MGFKALRVFEDQGKARLVTMAVPDLSPGNVLVKVEWSSLNYKDALAVTGRGKILRRVPLNPGIDLAGVVAESEDAGLPPGTPVLVNGMGLGETHDGAFAEYARIPAEWAIALPRSLGGRDAMALGSAGLTALMAIERLTGHGLRPESGPVVVTGASGGVGSLAVWLLSRQGFRVIAVSGRPEHHPYLKGLGAQEAVTSGELGLGSRPLESARFAAVIDNVGGELLAGLLRHVAPGGAIASIGHAGGSELHTTLYPFILRAVSLLGISGAQWPREVRRSAWERLARAWDGSVVGQVAERVVTLEEVPEAAANLLARRVRGRIVIAVDASLEEA